MLNHATAATPAPHVPPPCPAGPFRAHGGNWGGRGGKTVYFTKNFCGRCLSCRCWGRREGRPAEVAEVDVWGWPKDERMKMVAETVGVPLYMPEWPEPVPEARTRNGAGRVGGDWEPVCDPLCGCGHVTCPWCFIAAKRFDTDTVLTAIRRHYDEGYALAVLTGDWAGRGGEQRRIRRHHARYVRLRLDEARYLVLATAPVPGCGPPLSKLGCAALALRTIREAPFGHQPWLLGNSDFLELDDRGKPFAIPHDPDLGAWHAEVLAPHVAQHGTPDLPPLPVAPPAEPMQVVVSSGRYEG